MKFIRVIKSRNGNPLVLSELNSKIEETCKRFEIGLLYLFGAYARENADKLSDLDIAYLTKYNLTSKELLEFLYKLQDIFDEEAIDLVNLKEAPLPLIHRVLRDGKCIYAVNVKSRIDFETNKEDMYFDTEPLRKEYISALESRIENGSFGYR